MDSILILLDGQIWATVLVVGLPVRGATSAFQLHLIRTGFTFSGVTAIQVNFQLESVSSITQKIANAPLLRTQVRRDSDSMILS